MVGNARRTHPYSPGVWALGLLVFTALPMPARAQVSFVGVNAGAPISGTSILFTDALAADIASSGCRFVRINFIGSASGWDAAHLARYDTIIQNAANHDLEVLAVFSNETVPGYSQAQWNENYNTTGMNAYIATYAATAYMLINRYKADVKRFEIWNEPSCWAQDPNQHPLDAGCSYIWPRIFANLLAETYKECIAQGGPAFFSANGLSLVSGGLFAHDIGSTNPASATAYAHDLYDQADVWDAFQADPDNPDARRYPWDYFGYHFYLNQGSPVSTSELNVYFNRDLSGHDNDGIRTEQLAHDDTSPIIVSEFGWNAEGVTEQGKAENLRDSYDWMRTQPFIAAACWYQYNCCDPNGDWGLTQGIGNYEPAWFEFQAQAGQPGPPTADFAAFPLSGTAPLTVSFTELSSGLIDTYAWDFGDLGTAGEANPTHQYVTAGSYTVSLTVTGPGGQDTEIKTDYIVVTPPSLEADLDGDNDVDLSDFAIFAHCYTGPGAFVPPAGCETGSGVVAPATHTWESAASVAALTAPISGTDLVNGLSGVQEAGGFHPAVPGGDAGGLADLTDGAEGTGVEAVLQDFPGGTDPLNRALQVRYDFAPSRNIDTIRVFAANTDGRVFQNYDVHYSRSADPGFQTLLLDVATGPFGQSNPGSFGVTLTRIISSVSGPIAADVDALRFTFYPVSGTDSGFRDELDPDEPGDTDGLAEAFESSIIKEIDVFEFTGPVTANLADFDGDGDADIDDFHSLASALTGPK